MEVRVEHGDISQAKADAIVVNLFEGITSPGGGTGAVDRALNGAISRVIADGDCRGKDGELTLIHTLGKLPAPRVVVAGLGKSDKFTLDKVRDAALEKLEGDLRRYRLEALKPQKGSAFRKYDKRIIEAVRERGQITNMELMDSLRIAPGDREMVEAIRGKLEGLAKFNVIAPTANGWRWVLDRK